MPRFSHIAARTLLVLAVVVATMAPTARADAAGFTATNVYGQAGSFTGQGAGSAANKFSAPVGVAFDAVRNRLFVSEQGNHRVLVFDPATTDDTADYVLGQTGFNSSTTGLTATQLASPGGLAYDSKADRLYVADTGNNRILVFDTSTVNSGESAIFVLGQADFTSKLTGRTQTTFGGQTRNVALSADNRYLLATDEINQRVLVWDTTSLSNGAPAAFVIGQPDFTTSGCCGGQSQLYGPYGVTVDPGTNKAYIVDFYGDRVVVFDLANLSNGMSASKVFGQTSYTANATVTSQQQFRSARSVVAQDGRLFVIDTYAHRVLIFDSNDPAPLPAAVAVIGQPDFTSNASNNGGISSSTLSYPNGAAYDPLQKRLIIADSTNHRLLVFNAGVAGPAQITATVNPSLSFTVSGHASACNGVTPTASATATSVDLGRVVGGGTTSAAQDLTVGSNAGSGFVVTQRVGATTGPRQLTNVPGTNTTPAAFGTGEAFGYTVSGLSRFAGPLWAQLKNTPLAVHASSGPTSAYTACILYQLTTTSTTPAGTYTSTIYYTAVPTY